ncbi:MAG: hypothetical protein QGE99_04435 [SAR202 cluster bacterium]|nr:hypothetical protein [SAR202 cluster bacterium]HJO59262.1 hypothetical protein [SAR202 cluster bacterium]|tara:strand:- start:9384 stop:9974 length:591 start_codon:yes stop_codon:yes gene_type:complete
MVEDPLETLSQTGMRDQIRSQLLLGELRCWQYVLDLLPNRLKSAGSNLRGPAMFVSKSNSSSTTCGAVMTALMVLGAVRNNGAALQERTIAPMGYLNKQVPSNDIIEIPPSTGITQSDISFGHQLVELISFGAKVDIPIDCQKISGVDWNNPDIETVGAFLAPCGGIAKCTEIIAQAVEGVSQLTSDAAPTDSLQS